MTQAAQQDKACVPPRLDWGDDWQTRLVFVLGVVIALAHIYMNFTGAVSTLWQATWHFVGLGFLCVLLHPLHPALRRSKPGWVFELALGIGILLAVLYVVAAEDAIYDRGVKMTAVELGCAVIAIIGAIEFTRRTTGWIIPTLIILALSYVTLWGGWLDNVFKFSGLSTETVLFRSIYGDDALFGSVAQISATFVFMFILFGAFLIRSGAGDFVIALAQAAAGRVVGGPGIIAVISSGLTGTISGSAIANTVSTGVITIPLMQKAGFPSRFAAGVEAASSTGGQLMPPIMGAGAFVMASYTQIPYTHIVVISFLPALLYFLSVAFFVRIEAKRLGFHQTVEEGPGFMEIMRQGGLVFIVPITVLITLLVIGYTPTYAAGIAILSVIVSSWLTPNKMGWRAVLEALALGSRNMVTTGVLLVAVGLVVNVIAMTGLGNTLSHMIQEWAQGNLVLAIVLIALASLILGMGLPVTAAYIVLATLSAPALYNLMADAKLVEMIAAGAVMPESMTALLAMTAPEQVGLLGQPMSQESAQAILAAIRAIDPSMVIALYEQVLSPALLTTILLSAHMIIFWLSQDSNVTPPVCLTAFAAAAIAGTPQMRTGFTAWKLAKGLYIVPLLFAYTPLLGDDWLVSLEIFAFAAVALYAFAAAMQGYLESPLNWPMRLLAATAAVAMLYPGLRELHIAGLLVFVCMLWWGRRFAAHTA